MSALLAMLSIVVASSVCAVLLRRAGFQSSGRAVVAGAIAGLLIGPTVLGRLLPERHEAIFTGAGKERAARDYAQWFASNAPGAISGLEPEGLTLQREINQQEVAMREASLAAARWRHQRPLRLFAMSIVALTLLASMQRFALMRHFPRDWITPLSVGAWSFALPGALAFIAARTWWESDIWESACLAAAVGTGPWAFGAIDLAVSNGAEVGGARLLRTSGRIASAFAIALALGIGWHMRGVEGALLMSPLLMSPIAWTVSALAGHAATGGDAMVRARAPSAAQEMLLATLAALVAMRFDLQEDFALWPLLVLALLADDGRWLGAFIGAMLLGGRPGLRTMRLVMPAMAAGPTQLSIAALGLWGGLLSSGYALPLLAGAILIEVTAPMRRSMAQQLIVTEESIDDQAEG